MPRGMNHNGSIELAKAYVHGRLDEARELGLAKLDKKLNRKLSLWADRLAFDPMELRPLMGEISFDTQSNRLPSAGMQQPATGQTRNAVATVEVVERTYVGRTQGGEHRLSNSQDTPHQVNALPAPRKTNKPNNQWKGLTIEERLEETIRRFQKRKFLSPKDRKMMVSMQVKLAGMSGKKKSKKVEQSQQSKAQSTYWSKMTREERREEMQRRSEVRLKNQGKTPRKNHGKRDLKKQKIYNERYAAKKAGLPPPPLPGQAPEQLNVA